jgi:outer membrane protein
MIIRNTVSFAQRLRLRWLCHRLMSGLLIGLVTGGITQAEEFPQNIDGDIGLGAFYTSRIVRSKTDQISVLPYAYFSYDRAFVRLDTLGVKTWKLGYGYLEIAGRYSQDGFKADTGSLAGIQNRQTSIPLGIGTLQITPLGAFFINAFHDVNKSGGNLLEAIYVGELDASWLKFYPQLGAEYLSKEYARYYYGITSQEAASSQYAAYQPAGAFNPLMGLMVDAKLTEEYHINFYLRRRWLGSSINASPIVDQKFLDTGFVALSYRFK